MDTKTGTHEHLRASISCEPKAICPGGVKLADEGAAEGSEDKGCRTSGSVSFPGLARGGQLWPWLRWESRWAGTQHSFQVSQAAKTPSSPLRQQVYSSHAATASCRGSRRKNMTAGPGAAREPILLPDCGGHQDKCRCFSNSEGDAWAELPTRDRLSSLCAGQTSSVAVRSQS